jgi:hypothetical protein
MKNPIRFGKTTDGLRRTLATLALFVASSASAQIAVELSRVNLPDRLQGGLHLHDGKLVVGVGAFQGTIWSYNLQNPASPTGPVILPGPGPIVAAEGSRIISSAYSFSLQPSGSWAVDGTVQSVGGFGHDLRGGLMIQRANDGTSSTIVFRRQSSGQWLPEQTISQANPVGILSGERIVCGQGTTFRVYQRVKGQWFPTSVLPSGYRPEFRIDDDLFCREFQNGITQWRILSDTAAGFVYGGFVPTPPTVAPWQGIQLDLTREKTARSGSTLVIGCPTAWTETYGGGCGNCQPGRILLDGAALVYVRRPNLMYEFVGIIANPDPWRATTCPCGDDLFGTYVTFSGGLLAVGATAYPEGGVPAQAHIFQVGGDCDGNGISDLDELAAGSANDFNDNGIPDQCECLADLNGDGSVGGADLAALLAFWGPVSTFPLADINRDGLVSGPDLAALLGAWGACPQ